MRYVSLGLSGLLAGCAGAPRRIPAAVPVVSAAATPAAPGATAATGPSVSTPPPVAPRAAAEYAHALQSMKAGRGADAQLEFQQLALHYPDYSGPELNLGLLYLQSSRLEAAKAAFEAALARNPGNAIAGNELGIVDRELGKFAAAAAAYRDAIAARPNYAAAHLNLGILYDLYLDEPQKALDEYLRYIAIAGDDKQVAGWVVELRKRIGAPAPAPSTAPAPAAAPVGH